MKKESVGSKARTESPYNGGPKDPTDRNGAVALLRLCTTLLAAVSFWATAQGMKAYVFSQRWQAYAASLAVQGILLGLNFYLPSFWRAAKENAVKALLLGLSFVVLFCSSWFSFVYIVGQVYGDSWDIESQLLVQSAYRKAVYDGGDYAREYQEVLNEDLRQRITSLSSRARSLGNQTVVVNPYNWEEERLIYTAEDFSARSTMRTVIDAMERSMKDASPSVREQAADILITMRGVLEDEIESLTAQISSTSEAIVDANQSIRTAQNRVTSAPAGTDLAGLISQADQATAYAERLQTTLQEQQDKLGLPGGRKPGPVLSSQPGSRGRRPGQPGQCFPAKYPAGAVPRAARPSPAGNISRRRIPAAAECHGCRNGKHFRRGRGHSQ